MRVDIQRVLQFFFKGKLHGWINGATPTKDERWPGLDVIEFREGVWTMVEAYTEPNGSGYTWGFTMIWHDHVPVWVMTFGGWYDKHAVKFLKGVLRDSYRNEEFYGGRGQSGLTQERNGKRFEYLNEVTQNEPEHFRGRERMLEHDVKENGEIHGTLEVGTHEYWGMLIKK